MDVEKEKLSKLKIDKNVNVILSHKKCPLQHLQQIFHNLRLHEPKKPLHEYEQ